MSEVFLFQWGESVVRWGETVADDAPVYPEGRRQTGLGELFHLAGAGSEATFFVPIGDLGLDRCAIHIGRGRAVIVRQGYGVVCDVVKREARTVLLYPITGVRQFGEDLILWSFTALGILRRDDLLVSEDLVSDSLTVVDMSESGVISGTGWLNGESVRFEVLKRDLRPTAL